MPGTPSTEPTHNHSTFPTYFRSRSSPRRISSGPSARLSARLRTATSSAGGLTTDNIQKTFETLKASGVEFIQEPTTHFYGTDIGIRDPFGNNIRIVQLAVVVGTPHLDPPAMVKS